MSPRPSVPKQTGAGPRDAAEHPEGTGASDDAPRIQRERSIRLFGFGRRPLTAEQISEKAYSILNELLIRSVEEAWSFSELVDSHYIGFRKNGAVITNNLVLLRQEKDVVCWIKLSEIQLLQIQTPPAAQPLKEMVFWLPLACNEIAIQLTSDPPASDAGPPR